MLCRCHKPWQVKLLAWANCKQNINSVCRTEGTQIPRKIEQHLADWFSSGKDEPDYPASYRAVAVFKSTSYQLPVLSAEPWAQARARFHGEALSFSRQEAKRSLSQEWSGWEMQDCQWRVWVRVLQASQESQGRHSTCFGRAAGLQRGNNDLLRIGLFTCSICTYYRRLAQTTEIAMVESDC